MKAVEELASTIREYATRYYVTPAKKRGLSRFTIRAGDVHRGMGFTDNRVPAVCSALKSKKFLAENHLRVVDRTGPPSGLSTTVTYTYEFSEAEVAAGQKDPFEEMRGILKDVFADLGGGENFIKRERAAFEHSVRDEK